MYSTQGEITEPCHRFSPICHWRQWTFYCSTQYERSNITAPCYRFRSICHRRQLTFTVVLKVKDLTSMHRVIAFGPFVTGDSVLLLWPKHYITCKNVRNYPTASQV